MSFSSFIRMEYKHECFKSEGTTEYRISLDFVTLKSLLLFFNLFVALNY